VEKMQRSKNSMLGREEKQQKIFPEENKKILLENKIWSEVCNEYRKIYTNRREKCCLLNKIIKKL
jgi:hypothetical protein